jgi:lipopolysaccharide/colanic/teichoic acid biosynthesis glycosyltransferase
VVERQVILLVGDLLVVNLVLSAVINGVLFPNADPAHWLAAPRWTWHASLTALWCVVGPLAGCYDLRTALRPLAGIAKVALAAVLAGAVYVFLPRLSAPLTQSRGVMLGFVGGLLLGLAVWRLVCAAALSRPMFRRRVAIAGTGPAARELGAALRLGLDSRRELVGHIALNGAEEGGAGAEAEERSLAGEQPGPPGPDAGPDPGPGPNADPGHPADVAGAGWLLDVTAALEVDEVILATSKSLPAPLERAFVAAYEAGVQITPMAPVYEALTGRVPVEHVGSYWLVWLPPAAPGLTYAAFKRLADVVLAGVGLLVTTISFPLVALAIMLDSPGPVLFTQERVGRYGRPFRLVKFRTWTAGGDEHAGRGGARSRRTAGSRITAVGTLLRRSRLDELPQFWNVLRGDMSLIGPRPFVPHEVAALQAQIPFFRARLLVRPGLTGWAQVNHGYSNAMADASVKLQYDLYYLKHQSLYLDLDIVLKTLGVMLRFAGT